MIPTGEVLSAAEIQPSVKTGRLSEPIAVIGIGCRFPGARGPKEFWNMLCQGQDLIREVPPDRFNAEELYDPHPGTPGKLVTKWGAFIEDFSSFDNSFFGISPREAIGMDPQQRLLLEVGWEAMEDAGLISEKLAGSSTGVFVGAFNHDYEILQLYFCDRTTIDLYAGAGSAHSIVSGRLSYFFDFRGPSFTVDTACSSSLVAIHLACQSLSAGECSLALAGGVNVVLLPHPSIVFSRAGMLSADGRCKFGDISGDGFVRSDGAGLVVLKPLSRALADHDSIYAVILGSASSNDGRSSGFLTTPGRAGQEHVLRVAYERAGVAPNQVQYVEAHGPGTPAGDPIELGALAAVIGEGRPMDEPCILGSIKTNLGHTEGAAGVAGLIKVALSLHHRRIVPTLHLTKPSDKIPWDEYPLLIARELIPWPKYGQTARAGVSSFGISGTNAHVVLEERSEVQDSAIAAEVNEQGAELLLISAHSEPALRDYALKFRQFVADSESSCFLKDIAFSCQTRRTHHEHRLALVAASHHEAVEQLDGYLRGDTPPNVSMGSTDSDSNAKIVYVFPGQGSQWVGMSRELMNQEPVYRASMKELDALIRPHTGWSLMDQLLGADTDKALAQIDMIQPILFAIQVSLAALWRSWGVEPEAVVGHSMGEIAAAYIAGALNAEDAVRLSCQRSRLLRSKSGQGAMLVVELSFDEARQAIAGYEDRVALAVSNSRTSTVLSGEPKALEEIMGAQQAKDIYCRPVKADVASHSPQMDDLRADLLRVLAGLSPRTPTIPFYSTVQGELNKTPHLDASYWVRNLRNPVLFSSVIERLLKEDHRIFIEMSPHPILLNAINDLWKHLGIDSKALPSGRREESERRVLLESIGSLYCKGRSVDWSRLHPSRGRFVRLPSYAWQHERFWRDDAATSTLELSAARSPSSVSKSIAGVTQRKLSLATNRGDHIWEMDISRDSPSYVKDHQLQGAALVPAVAYVEMAIAAGAEVFEESSCLLEEISLKQALFVSEGVNSRVQLIVSPEGPGTARFQFFSMSYENAATERPWNLHAEGRLSSQKATGISQPFSVEQVMARCPAEVSRDQHYERMRRWGLDYGPAFQGVERVWRGAGEALGVVNFAQENGTGQGGISPLALDAALQVVYGEMLSALEPSAGSEALAATYLPVAFGRVRLSGKCSSKVWAHAQIKASGNGRPAEGVLYLRDDTGEFTGEIEGLQIANIGKRDANAEEKMSHNVFYQLCWQPAPAQKPVVTSSNGKVEASTQTWLVLSDDTGVANSLSARIRSLGGRSIEVSTGNEYAVRSDNVYTLNVNDPSHLSRLFSEMSAKLEKLNGIVYLGALDLGGLSQDAEAQFGPMELVCATVANLVRILAQSNNPQPPRLCLVTKTAVMSPDTEIEMNPAQAALWGLARAIVYEHPEIRCSLMDLSTADSNEIDNLADLLYSQNPEDEVALRGQARFVARLRPAQLSKDEEQTKQRVVMAQADRSFRLETLKPGVLDNLVLRSTADQRPETGKVKIRVRAAALNFRDLMMAMGIYPNPPADLSELGLECSGEVVEVGPRVNGLKVGDPVVAFVMGAIGSFAIAAQELVFHKPANVTFEEAATIPIVFATAYHALHDIGRLQPGERVLIHLASGGVGMAAIQLARLAGAEIFATAGSEEKRAFLRSLGIQHVFDSRSTDFVGRILAVTNNEGIDVVLNSLPGDAIAKGLSLLRQHGRFVEIGRMDVYGNRQLGLLPFRNNLSFAAIDMTTLIFREKHPLVVSGMKEVLRQVEAGALQPIAASVFSIAQAVEAFHLLAQGKHIGKVVIALNGAPVPIVENECRKVAFSAHNTYLITGGLGGLGLTLARWMVDNGARNLVLASRRGTSAEAHSAIETMERAGARVNLVKADIACSDDAGRLFEEIRNSMPPLKGVVHAAVVLDDGVVEEMTIERFNRVMAPKIQGAWNLHKFTAAEDLDFLAFFSSAASLLGSPGQGNYCAANAFLDAFAHDLRRHGRPAVSMNWGPWSEVGAAARPDRGGRLSMRGIHSINPKQGMEFFSQALESGLAQIGIMYFDWPQWAQFYPAIGNSSLFAEFRQRGDGSSRADKAKLATAAAIKSAAPEARRTMAEEYVVTQVARILRLAPAKVDSKRPLIRMGIDSLMGVELKNRIVNDTGVTLPLAKILKGANVSQVAESLLQLLVPEAPDLVNAPDAHGVEKNIVLAKSA